MARVNPPSRIRLVGKDYAVRMSDLVDASGSLHGYCSSARCEILLATENVDPQQLRDTLLHEILHAIASETGLSNYLQGDTEEQVCVSLAPSLLATLRDNPRLVRYLLAE